MLPFRRFSVLQLLAQAAALSGPQHQAKMKEADARFQNLFDPQRQEQLRKQYTTMPEESKMRIDVVVAHTLRLTDPEMLVFSEELRKAKLKQLGAKDALGLAWNPLVRKGAEKPFGEGSGLERYGLTGFPAETTLKLLKGEFAAKITEAPKEVAKPVEEAPKEEEKATLDIYLSGFKAETKVALIKLVKDLMKLGLKESKDKVEEALKAPTLLLKSVPRDKVKDIQSKLEAAGGKLDIK